jgi:tetratricopeptide (TPR) repeat protein
LLCERADAALLLGRPVEAAKAIEEGLILSAADPLASARCLQKRSSIAQTTGDSQASLDYALKAQARLAASPVARPEMDATLLADIAAAHYLVGHAAEADKYFAASLAKYKELGRDETPATIAVRNNWGVATEGTGDYRAALQLYDDAIRIARKRSAGGEVPTYLLANRAQTLTMLGRYAEALAADAAAIESATRSGHALGRMKSRVNRVATFLEMGDLANAERELDLVAAEATSTGLQGESPQAISIRYWRAEIVAARAGYAEAMSEFAALVELYDQRKQAGWGLARALRSRGEAYLALGNPEAALQDAERSLKIARSLQGSRAHSALTGRALFVMARVQQVRGADGEARAAAAEAATHLSAMLGEQHPETVAARRAAL